MAMRLRIDQAVQQRLDYLKGHLQNLPMKHVRRLLEADLDMPRKALDAEKEYIRMSVNKAVGGAPPPLTVATAAQPLAETRKHKAAAGADADDRSSRKRKEDVRGGEDGRDAAAVVKRERTYRRAAPPSPHAHGEPRSKLTASATAAAAAGEPARGDRPPAAGKDGRPPLAPVATQPCRDLRALAALCASSPPGTVIDLGGRVISGSLPAEAAGVLTLSQPNTTLMNGTLSLTGRQRITVDGAAGVCFESVSVLNAAAAAGESDCDKDLVTVCGQGATLRLLRCAVKGQLDCNENSLLSVREGALLTLEHTRVEGAARSMACCVEGGSSLFFRASTLTACRGLLWLSTRSTAVLEEVTLSCSLGANAAVRVSGCGTALSAQHCTWSSGTGCGLWLDAGASATLAHCGVTGCKAATGVLVTELGTSLTATASRFSDNAAFGLCVRVGATAALEGCQMRGSESRGGLGVWGAGSRVVATGSQFTDNREFGAVVCEGGAVELQGCQLSAPAACSGLEVWDQGSTVVARDCSLTGSVQCGVAVHQGAQALLHRCNVGGNKRGPGEVHGEGSRLRVLMCTVADGAFLAADAGQLEKAP